MRLRFSQLILPSRTTSSPSILFLFLLFSFGKHGSCLGHVVQQQSDENSASIDLFTEPEVFITLCAVAGIEPDDGSYLDTMIELNWARFPPPATTNDWIGLFNFSVEGTIVTDPSQALSSIDVSQASGYFKTGIRFGRPDLSDAEVNNDNGCLGFWIAYMKPGVNPSNPSASEPILTNCFRKYPTWMNDLKDIIGNKPLHSLMIPGTHDAGAIREYDGQPSELITVKYSVNQEEQLYRQFVHGIRYVDMRVAFYGNTPERFWINHGSARFAPLITLLNAVKQFVEETAEIIFMDFHGFPVGMAELERHAELLQFVEAELGDVLVYKSMLPVYQNVTPNQLWELNRTVILTYQRDDISSQNDMTWPYLIHAWGNVNQVAPLEEYFADKALPEYGCSGIFWSAMAEMTPTAADSILFPNRGLRGFAQMVNIPLTYWWERPEWYSRTMIVSTDFFLGNNIIEMAVKVNRNQAVCPPFDDDSPISTTTDDVIPTTNKANFLKLKLPIILIGLIISYISFLF